MVAVLTGLINKELVSTLHQLGGRAIGISGIDGGLLQARIANPELGFVGELDRVNCGPIKTLLESGQQFEYYCPVSGFEYWCRYFGGGFGRPAYSRENRGQHPGQSRHDPERLGDPATRRDQGCGRPRRRQRHFPVDAAAVVVLMRGDQVTFRLHLNLGEGEATAWGCDLTEQYVIINSAYTT